MAKVTHFVLLALGLNCARGHVAYLGLPNRLHQVAHGVYVNPSADGNSADLYVAATEDNNIKTSWLTDHPVNYLQPGQVPLAYTSTLTTNTLPREEIVTNQKRAVISSPPIKYAYALPVSSDSQNHQNVPYSYAVPSTPAKTEGTECSDAAAAAYPYALHWYYSQMMAAFANALNNVAKENTSEEITTTSTPTTPVWPSYYPVQYVMVDPTAWAKSQAATTTTTPAPPTSASDESV